MRLMKGGTISGLPCETAATDVCEPTFLRCLCAPACGGMRAPCGRSEIGAGSVYSAPSRGSWLRWVMAWGWAAGRVWFCAAAASAAAGSAPGGGADFYQQLAWLRVRVA